jgi:hypothetical protein
MKKWFFERSRKVVPFMPNDAKLGLVLGIALVVIIGMVFFRGDPPVSGANPPPTNGINAQISASQDAAP